MEGINFFQSVFILLTGEAGSLAYHLVLAFSAAAALQLCLVNNRDQDALRTRRAAAGLGLILALQLARFVLAGFAWQGIFRAELLLPALDRALSLVSLLVIVWMWLFPDPTPRADAAALLLGGLLVVSSLLAMVWWVDQPYTGHFNASLLDGAAAVTGLCISLLGSIALVVRRPDGWSYGAALLTLVWLGYLAHLASPPLAADYPGAVRLAQMAAFPLLLLLPFRRPAETPAPAPAAVRSLPAEAPPPVDPNLLQSFLDLLAEDDPAEVSWALSAALGRLLHADVCLVVNPEDEEHRLQVQAGYDQAHDRFMPAQVLDGAKLPALCSALQSVKPSTFAGGESSAEMTYLAGALGLKRTGPVMAAQILGRDEQPGLGVICLSPASEHAWLPEDQAALRRLLKPLAGVLQMKQRLAGLQVRADELQRLQEPSLEQDERSRLLDQIADLQREAESDKAQLVGLALLVAQQQEAQETIRRLQAEVERLSQPRLLSEMDDASQFEGELHMALEEIAQLKKSLWEADQKLLALQLASVSSDHLQELNLISRELQQQSDSLVDYIEILSGDSLGALGPLQRKFLERVKSTTHRIQELTRDLTLSGSGQENPLGGLVKVDPAAVLAEAVEPCRQLIEGRNLSLDVQIDGKIPPQDLDADSLRKVLTILIQRASQVTPEKGRLKVDAWIGAWQGEPAASEAGQAPGQALFFRVIDGGGQLSGEELGRLFLSAARPGEKTEEKLPFARLLVDVMGGRIFAANEPGHGLAITLELPLAASVERGQPR